MYFTLLGKKDAWNGRDTITFLEKDEIEEFLAKNEVEVILRNEEEGQGKTMKGDIKWWHMYSYIIKVKI